MANPAGELASNLLDRRVTACVKACEGVPTKKLEEGILIRLVAACIHLEDPEVTAIIDELVPRRGDLVAESARNP